MKLRKDHRKEEVVCTVMIDSHTFGEKATELIAVLVLDFL